MLLRSSSSVPVSWILSWVALSGLNTRLSSNKFTTSFPDTPSQVRVAAHFKPIDDASRRKLFRQCCDHCSKAPQLSHPWVADDLQATWHLVTTVVVWFSTFFAAYCYSGPLTYLVRFVCLIIAGASPFPNCALGLVERH